ncbi:MAG: hypothetical protein FWC93_03490 [Defluviitaleaceae bacterium]|nr:hypothetical protein [Defluviitaleaceae bacterium]
MNKKIKGIFTLLMAMVVSITTILPVSVSASGRQELDINMAHSLEALWAIGIELELNLDGGMPRLQKLSHNEPIAILSEVDVDIMLDALKVAFELTDSTVYIDWDITSALKEAGLRDYFNDGVRLLLQEEREYALINMVKNNTFYELVDMGVFDRPGILEELESLNLLNEIFEAGKVSKSIGDMDTNQDWWRHFCVIPSRTIVTRQNLYLGSLMTTVGDVIDFNLSFIASFAGGHLEVGTWSIWQDIFTNGLAITTFGGHQTRQGTFLPRGTPEQVGALRASSGNTIDIITGYFTIWVPRPRPPL